MASKVHGHKKKNSLQQDVGKDHKSISRKTTTMHKLIYGVHKVVNGKRKLRWDMNLLGEEVNTRAKEGK
jgi:hypothetical protein